MLVDCLGGLGLPQPPDSGKRSLLVSKLCGNDRLPLERDVIIGMKRQRAVERVLRLLGPAFKQMADDRIIVGVTAMGIRKRGEEGGSVLRKRQILRVGQRVKM